MGLRQVEGPVGLVLVEVLSSLKVLQILVICPNLNCVLSTLEEMTPFFESSNNGQHLLVRQHSDSWRGMPPGATCHHPDIVVRVPPLLQSQNYQPGHGRVVSNLEA
jgi:hypothetical protein